MSWRSQAACAGVPLEVFFPETTDARQRAKAVALRFCQACPSRLPCREEADLNRDLGVRAGVLGRADNGAYQRDLLLPGVELADLPVRPRRLMPDRRRAS